MKRSFESEYLNKKLEPTHVSVISENIKIAGYEDFGEHSYEEEIGSFEFFMGETRISLKFSRPEFQDIFGGDLSGLKAFKKLDFLSVVRDEMLENFVEFTQRKESIKKIRIIDEMILENKDGRFDTKEIFNDKKIYFNIPKDLEPYDHFNLHQEAIILSGDPLTPEGLLSLGHEIGHYFLNKDEWFSKPISRKELKNINEQQAELFIKEERGAWAYALNIIRPFIKDLALNLKDIDKYIHEDCLKSHSEKIDFIFSIQRLRKEDKELAEELERLFEEYYN